MDIKPPSGLGKIAKKEFDRIKEELAQIGYLNVDRGILESYLESYELFKMAQEHLKTQGPVIVTPKGQAQINPWHTVLRQHQENIKKCMSELGFSAGSRKRLQIELSKPQTDDDLYGG